MSQYPIPDDLQAAYELASQPHALNGRIRNLIERIARLEAQLAEAKAGWDSCIADLREAAAICARIEQTLRERDETIKRLVDALTMIYDKWEDGVNCYEASDGEAFDESGTSLGHAVKLDFEEENQILALIPAFRAQEEQ